MPDQEFILIPESILIYPSLYEPTAFKDQEPSYQATFLIEKDADIKPIREACRQAAYRKFGTQINMSALNFPVRDGNELAIDDNGHPDPNNFYYNRLFIRTKSKFKVPIVNVFNDEITDPEEIYGGCKVAGYVVFFGYDYMGKKGVSAGLRAVCKIADGDPLGGGRVNTGEAFKQFLKPKDTFMDNPPVGSERRNNELGQQNHDPLRDSDPWGDNEPPQEPPGGVMREPGDESNLPF